MDRRGSSGAASEGPDCAGLGGGPEKSYPGAFWFAARTGFFAARTQALGERAPGYYIHRNAVIAKCNRTYTLRQSASISASFVTLRTMGRWMRTATHPVGRKRIGPASNEVMTGGRPLLRIRSSLSNPARDEYETGASVRRSHPPESVQARAGGKQSSHMCNGPPISAVWR